ncbi:hypothetical protein E3J74_02425 [Candidatus Bathyarchaeota archaeon]|nr:MAG: hypothetical protein E3J74_02425 [Candidatus Bathyarchaeota archaeon]
MKFKKVLLFSSIVLSLLSTIFSIRFMSAKATPGLITMTATIKGTYRFDVDTGPRIVGGAGCVEPPPGLVGWWPGDGNASDIIDANHGTLVNGATFAAGKVGQAFSFDGVDDYVEIPYDPSFNLLSFTLEAWVKFTQNDAYARIICRPSDGNPTDGYSFFTLSNNRGKIGGGVQGEGQPYSVSVSASPSTFADDNWHMASFVRDVEANEISIYVDGGLYGSYPDSSPGDMEHNYQGIIIGSTDGSTDFFKGLIDEVGIYNRALSASEIQAIYNAGSAGKCKQPIPDDTTPPIGSVEINGGAATTDSVSVTLTLYAEDAESGVAEMRFSNDGSVWSNWEVYAPSKAWTLTAGDGTKTVYVKFKNNAGLVSDTYSDTIVLSIGKESSSISISMSATTFAVGESASVSGFLSPPCEGASVMIQCRPSGGTWTTLEKVTTGTDGGYWCTWTPTTAGTYEVRASWEGDETTLSSESIGQPVTVTPSTAAAFPLWVLAPVIGGITGVTAVLVYLKRRKPKEEVLKPAEPIITAEPTEIPVPAKKTEEEVLKPPEEFPPQKVKELPKLSEKCSDTIALLNSFVEDPSRTNDRKAWKGFREFIAIAEQIEDEYAELIEIRNKLAVLRRKRNEYRSAGLDDLADKTEGFIQSNYGESIRIIKEIQEKLPHLGG